MAEVAVVSGLPLRDSARGMRPRQGACATAHAARFREFLKSSKSEVEEGLSLARRYMLAVGLARKGNKASLS